MGWVEPFCHPGTQNGQSNEFHQEVQTADARPQTGRKTGARRRTAIKQKRVSASTNVTGYWRASGGDLTVRCWTTGGEIGTGPVQLPAISATARDFCGSRMNKSTFQSGKRRCYSSTLLADDAQPGARRTVEQMTKSIGGCRNSARGDGAPLWPATGGVIDLMRTGRS